MNKLKIIETQILNVNILVHELDNYFASCAPSRNLPASWVNFQNKNLFCWAVGEHLIAEKFRFLGEVSN